MVLEATEEFDDREAVALETIRLRLRDIGE
jgi:hypothetical protein